MKKIFVLIGLVLIAAALVVVVAPTAKVAAQPAAADAPALSCTECHNATGVVAIKTAGWEVSAHGDGTAMAEEYGNKSCSFCHSGNSFRDGVKAGKNFSNIEAAAAEPARQDCYTCHDIHNTYTAKDWAIRTKSAVALVTSKATFDGGAGNLCANCHQARRYMANFAAKDAAGAVIPDKYAISARFNTHYSVQVDTLMGLVDVAKVLGVEGKPAAHYSMVKDTCVACHLGEAKNHTFAPQVSACVGCHKDATSLDVDGFQTSLAEKVKQLEEALLAKKMIAEGAEGMAAVPTEKDKSMDAKPAAAMFVYFLYEEDGSMGVHNPKYFTALVDAALAALK